MSNAERARQPLDPQASVTPFEGLERTRQRILDAASQLFAHEGFARARIGEIALAAGVSRALIYRYFKSKEEIWFRVQQHMLDEWTASAERLLSEPRSVSEALAEWVRMMTDARRRPFLEAMMAEDAQPLARSWEPYTRQARVHWWELLVTLLRRGVAEGEFRSDLDVESAADVLRATQLGMIIDLFGENSVLSVGPDRFVDSAIELMLSGLRPRR